MAYTNVPFEKRASDLVIDSKPNYSNDNANITPAGVIPFGTVVFRAKSLDETAPWAAVSDALDMVDTNEFGVVYGDGYGFKADFTPAAIAAGRFNAVIIKRDANVKEFYLKQVLRTAAADFAKLKALLANQGVIVNDTVA